MTRTQRRTKIKSGFAMAVGLIFLIALLICSLALGAVGTAKADDYESLNYSETTITNGVVEDYLAKTDSAKNACTPADGVVRTKEQFCYVFLSPVGGTYTLGADFKITATNWASNAPTIFTGCSLNGNQHTIWNAAIVSDASASTSIVGGLIATNQGEIKNLNYYFTGSLYVKKHSSSDSVCVGGMIGRNAASGRVLDSNIVLGGAITTEGRTENVTSAVGGMVGDNQGTISGCEINSSATIEAYSDKDTGSSRSKHNIVYAGGVIGLMQAGNIVSCDVKSSASVISADNTDKWEVEIPVVSQVFDFLSGLFKDVVNIEVKTEYNDKEHVHPAGVMIGCLANSGAVRNSDIELTGSAVSYGMAGSSNGGSIAGGMVGYLHSNCTASAGLQSNKIKLSCALSGFFLESTDVSAQLSEWIASRDITVYLGALFGRSVASKLLFSNNFIYINKDNGIIEDGADYDSEAYDCESGLICGSGSFASLVGKNNWLARKLSECDTGRIICNARDESALNHMCIFGDGEVTVSGKITNATSFTMVASPNCSPFYGWTQDMGAAAPIFTTARTKTFSNSGGAVHFAVFVDTKIESSGELTQLAKDINQIKEKVWSQLNVSNSDARIYYPSVSIPTLSWLNVSLEKDILVEKGTPVIESFYGNFDGKGNTISFAAGSRISHDFEQERTDTADEYENNNVPDYATQSTGLFGRIEASGVVANLNILFGGAITETSGLKFNAIKDAAAMIASLKYVQYNQADRVKSRTFAFDSFELPTSFDFDKCYCYFLTGSGYSASRTYNPGYLEIVPYTCETIIARHFVGILAGVNAGTIANVNVEAGHSAYINVSAEVVYFGTLCGSNIGNVTNASSTMRGRALLKGRAAVYAGGMFGTVSPSATNALSGLSAFVAGEIRTESALNYHLMTMYKYTDAVTAEDSNQQSNAELPDGYTKIASDWKIITTTTSTGNGGSTSVSNTVEIYKFGVKGLMGTETVKLIGNDNTAVAEGIGSLIGLYNGNSATITNAVAVSGAKGSFNTKIYQTDSSESYVGGLIGVLATSQGIPTFQNVWAGMSYEEYDKGTEGRTVIGTESYSTKTGVNVVYVQSAIVVPNVDTSATLPISFTLEAREGMTFSGWYDYTSGARSVITSGLEGSVFTPQNQSSANLVYIAEVINLQIFSEAEVKKLAASTNEGRGYLGVEFTIGTDITLTSFTPIGVEGAPFRGTLDGNGLTIRITSGGSGDLFGLFGCIGAEGVVKNIVVNIPNTVGSSSTRAAGAVAAINEGTIGQDTSIGKVVAEIKGSITAKYVGGIVGINRNLVKNAEAHFLYSDEYDYGQIFANTNDTGAVYAGGAIGYNESFSTTAVAKNLIVYFNSDVERSPLNSVKSTYAIGGVIGENGLGSASYSLVSVMNDGLIVNGSMGSAGSASRYAGLIIGHNASKNVDGLWALYLSKSKSSSDPLDPELGAPVQVYGGDTGNVTTDGKVVLVNGEESKSGNILIKYGWGNVSVRISGASSVKGGQITFFSEKISGDKAADFYDYVANFYNGERVAVTEGNTGYAFSPTVGTADKAGLTGKVYYAAFCNSSIANQNDYIAVQQNIERDYRLYVEYNVTNSFTLDAMTATKAIGTAEKPFRGRINGNAYTVTMNSASLMHAFIGVLGENDGNYYSAIGNLRLAVQSGTKASESGTDVTRGFLTDVNNGTISGVNLTVRGSLTNLKGSAGTVAGTNNGVIASAAVTIEYANYLGVDGFGAILAKIAGGLVGVNNGVIGNGTANAIDISVTKGSVHGGTLYGAESVGAVAGVNEETGVVRSAIVTLSGSLMGGNASSLVGYNKGEIKDAFVSVNHGATYFGTAAFGMIAGRNDGVIGVLQDDYSAVIRGYLYAAPTFGSAIAIQIGSTTLATTPAATTAVIGGAVGVNGAEGSVTSLLIELHASIISSVTAGGLVGENGGNLSCSNLLSTDGSGVFGAVAGGIIGRNNGTADRLIATMRGSVGSLTAADGGIPATSYAGGVTGRNDGVISNSVVTLYRDVYGENVGLGSPVANLNSAQNVWTQICNSSLTPVSASVDSGFNVIRVLNETLLSVSADYNKNQFTFTSLISGVKNWYTDISAWTASGDGVLTEGLKTKMIYMPAIELRDKVYYVCYDELAIRNINAFNNLATLINSRSYYRNVLFRLEADLNVASGTVVRPIGTEEYPFNGIFNGGFRTITFRTGSGISGPEYTGLFGYVAGNSLIENFILNIEEGVSIGSVNSYEVGALAGRNYGRIENVFVNLSAKVTYNSQKRYAGAMIGRQMPDAPAVVNSWISILNESAPAVGNMVGRNAYGVNYIGVLGNGATEVKFLSAYQPGTTEDIKVIFSVPTGGTNPNTALYARCTEYFRNFGGWFDDIRSGNRLSAETVSGLGDFTHNGNENDRDVSLTPIYGAENQRITLSFIALTIRTEDDFIRFANNINTYGDQGAKFSLMNDITVDFTKCASVGTPERPFTGEFNGNGNKIMITGTLIKRDYAGVFGYVGVGGLVKNLYVDVTGENVKVGDKSTLYSGVAVALLYGEIKNVVVAVRADTVVYTTQGLASSGGIVGRAGKVGENGAEDISYRINNCWLVSAENSSVINPVGEDPDLTHPDYYRTHKATCGEGRRMQMVGEQKDGTPGKLSVYITAEDVQFDASANGYDFYGFIDNANLIDEVVEPIHDGGATSSIHYWTILPGSDAVGAQGEKDKNGAAPSSDMLCVIINKYIGDTEDLEKVSENVSKGRNYRGITYELTADIILPTSGFDPIGGEVITSSTTGVTNYIERDFIGGFNGKGHTITMPEGLSITARYAGLFGRVGASARISDLTIDANARIGYDTGENTTRTIYAGILAAYALGGSYQNIVINMGKRAVLYGSVGIGRTFGYLPRAVGDVAENCWVISYNSKENYELNASEILYNQSFLSTGVTPDVGSNQGGVNNLMVVAAGSVSMVRQENNVKKYHFTYTGTSYWYDLNAFSGDKKEEIGASGGYYEPASSAKRIGYNVSFLNSEIASLADLKTYAESINEGYNFYKLTFTLHDDIVIGKNDGFVAIGTETSGVNGTFDGQGHTITVDKETVVGGKYAGLFGYIAADGTVTNLRIVMKGTLGRSDFTGAQVAAGAVNTLYAGAVAYNKGRLENVIVISEGAALSTLNGVSGIAIGYDETNLVKNVWALVDASSYLNSVGRSAAGDTGVNTMKIIGIGTVDAFFTNSASDYRVTFRSTSEIPVMGWYKSFEKNQQISSAMLSSGSLSNGTNGSLVAPLDHFGVNYEVAVVKTNIETALELIALAEDVNIGGYSFENLTFTLGADIEIPTSESRVGYLPIGTSAHPFKGTFTGKYGSDYHQITVRSGYGYNVGGIFGYNAGEIRDLSVLVNGTIGELTSSSDHIYGTVASVNVGTVEGCFVEIRGGAQVIGYTVGGVVGSNRGTVRDCVVIVRGVIEARTAQGNTVNAGALVGVNYGVVEGSSDFSSWIERDILPKDVRMVRSGNDFIPQSYAIESNVFIYGSVSAIATSSSAYANAGGAVGNNYGGSMAYVITYLPEDGSVTASASSAQGARAGGLVGYARAAVNHSVSFLYGEIVSESLLGGTAGYLDGVTAMNVWQVTLNRILSSAGAGSKSVNSLNIKGNGKLKASIDTFAKSVMFTNITDDNGSRIDGWYTAATIEVDEKTGNVGENGNTFIPLAGVQNKYVMVVFVNTEIRSAADLQDMAASVGGALSGEDIVFTLMNDIEVEAGDLKETIGSLEYPFNNIFDGQGHTITLKAGALAGEEYVGLFGYTGMTSTIRNLTLIAEAGVYGAASSERSALLVAYNQGRITNVTVTLSEGAELVGQIAGAVAASSFGTMEDITLDLKGKVLAQGSANTAIAGGLVGVNDGTISRMAITFASSAEVKATGAATSYAGVVAGENYQAISVVSVLASGSLSAEGAMTAYSGVGVGLNLGYIDRAYVETDHPTFGAGISGGLVGNNVNALTTSLVKIVGEDFTGSDSAIGYARSAAADKVYNVWVYSDRVGNLSQASCVNGMSYDAYKELSCPTAADVAAGKISFTSVISEIRTTIAFFANVTDGDYSVGTGAAMENVTYADGKITYLGYDLVSEEAVPRRIANVRVRFVTRAKIGSGSELYAFAMAMGSGEYAFDNATFSLTADFALPDGAFPAITLPSAVTFDGAHHVVTVGDALLSEGLFRKNEGAIKNLGMRLTKEEAAGSLVTNNLGSIANAVIYLERGASLPSGNFFAATNSGEVENLWIVSREDIALAQGAVSYAVIKINGVGSLAQGGENGLNFTATTRENMLFIGYTTAGAIFSAEELFDTADKAVAVYTAEFISTMLDTDYELQVLSDVSALGYRGEGVTFTVGADLTANDSLFASADAGFVGTIAGGGHKITAAAGVTGSLFGKFTGEITDLILDLSALTGDVTLFGGTDTVSLTRVVIVEERSLLSIGAPVRATNVWIESENNALYEAFRDTSAYTANYSLLYKNGAVSYRFAEGITAVAEDSDEQVFAGWYGEKGAVKSAVAKEKSYLLSSEKGNVVKLNYINRTFAVTDDLLRLAEGVRGGFAFEGVDFFVADGVLTVDCAFPTIGDEEHPFKGNIRGGVGSEILFDNYSTEDAFEVHPFLHRLFGEMTDLLFRYKQGALFTGGAALVEENAGLMSAIVVLSENRELFKEGAGLTLLNGGEIKNSWLVTKGEEKAVSAGSLVGANELRLDEDTILTVSFGKSSQGTKVLFTFTPIVGHFVCLYDYAGTVVFPGNYNYPTRIYTAPATSSGTKLAVKSPNGISLEDELVYLGYLTAGANFQSGSVITLDADLTVERNLREIISDGLILNLAGHKITLAATTSAGDVLFGKKTQAGTLCNGSVYLRKGYYGIGAAGMSLDNVSLFLEDGAMTLPAYRLNQVTVITADRSYKDSLSAESGEYFFLYAPKGAAISAVYDEHFAVSFVGEDNDLYYFGAIDDGESAREQIAYFAPKTIRTAEDYYNFASAANYHADHLKGAVVTLAEDITVNGANTSSVTYAGTLLAGGHTVTIEGGDYASAYLTLAEGGTATDLALAFKGAAITADRLVSVQDGESRIALVVYQTDDTAKQVEEDALVANVYGQGTVEVTFADVIRFTALQSGNYALRKWTNAAGEDIGNASVYAGGESVSAHFALRYLVTVEFTGVSEEILRKNENNLPRFKGTGIYFADEIESAHADIIVEIENIGEGFLFRGLTSTASTVTQDGSDKWKFRVAWTIGSYDIPLRAELTYVEMAWSKATYTAAAHSGETLGELRDAATALGYSVQYSYTPLGATPALVDGAPYHAGTYLVSFRAFFGGKMMCNAYCGLEIEQATLRFDSILIKDKDYDGTTKAELLPGSLRLDGFMGDDEKYVSLEGLTFSFADKNAEQGKLVYVAGDATLAYDATEDAAGTYRYVYLDYKFDSASISSSAGLIRANINRKTLKLSVDSISVEYLDQFEAEAPAFLPTVVSGLVEADRAAFNLLAATLMTRENASSYDAGYYRIIVGDSLAFPNYLVELTGTEAYYVVRPSLVKVIFDEDQMTYGDSAHTPAYHVFVGIEGGNTYRALREGDELFFSEVVYHEGGALIPGETRYSFTCLFSAENKNYTVIATDGYKIVNGTPLAILKGEGLLKVLPKTIYVTADDARNAKRVGRRTESITASLASKNTFVMAEDTLVVSRAAGESVGSYALSFAVRGKDGADVTAYYDIKPLNGTGYFFTITPVTLIIKPSKTSVIYGTPISSIKYGVSVEGGGISLADLYYAMTGTEKRDVTLSDLGINAFIGYDNETILNVGEYDAGFDWGYLTETARKNISDIRITSTQKMIIVQKRYLTVTISDYKKTYDGVKEFRESAIRYKTEGLLERDQESVRVKRNSYTLIGEGVSVGVYKIDGSFSLESTGGDAVNNYFITVVQGNFTIEPARVTVAATAGYFDENGAFTPAVLDRSGIEVEDTIYYGDSKAALCFRVTSGGAFLKIPDNASDKEVSDYIASALKISYNRLNKLAPFDDDGKTTADILGLISANNNVKATFNAALSIAPVYLTVRVLSVTKTIGEPDPELTYEIIAQDPENDYEIIPNYSEISAGTFTVTVTGDRTEGETLGSYTYSNIKIDVVNTLAGESLFDDTTDTGKAFNGYIESDGEDEVTLSIEQKSFMKTTLGKWLVYGGSLAILAVAVVLLLVLIPHARKKTPKNGGKKRATKQKGKDALDEEKSNDGSDEPSEEKGKEEVAETEEANGESDLLSSDPAPSEPASTVSAEKEPEISSDDLFATEAPTGEKKAVSSAMDDLDFDPASFDISDDRE